MTCDRQLTRATTDCLEYTPLSTFCQR